MSTTLETITKNLGKSSNWGRWLGAVILLDVLFVWTWTCLNSPGGPQMVPIDPATMSLVLGVFLINAVKSSLDNRPAAAPAKEG